MTKYVVSNEVEEGNETIFKLHPDGTGELTEGIPKDNRMGLQVDIVGRIKMGD